MSSEQPNVEEINRSRITTPELTERQKRWFGIVVIVLICAASFWLALNPVWVERFGTFGYVGAFLISLIASATIVLPAPGIFVVIAMSAALDPLLLGLISGLGSAVGELTGYAAGRGGRALIPEENKHQFARIQELTQKHGALLLAVWSAVPMPLFDFAGIVAGAMRMRVSRFLLAVTIGKSIKYTIMIMLGSTSLQWLQQYF